MTRNILDDLGAMRKLDPGKTWESIEFFLDQCLQVLKEIEPLDLPNLEGRVSNVVVAGMGGSGFAPEIVKTLFADKIKVPYEIIKEYHLPGYVDKKTLVIISSYSATTKEAIACAQAAFDKKSLVYVVCSHNEKGELFSLINKKHLSGYIFEETYNPSKQPRLGSGYMVFGHLGILIKSGLLDFSFSNLKQTILGLQKNNLWGKEIKSFKNPAKQMAQKLKDKFVILVASEFLQGAIHGFANQLNESAKTASTFHFIPEFNHHRLEGLEFPEEFKKIGVFIFYPSLFYDKRNLARYEISKEVVKKCGFETLEFQPLAKDKIGQTLETIIFDSYVSFYLAMLYGKNPYLIPWVDFFKEQMKKRGF